VLRGVPPGKWYVSATRDGYELSPPTGREIVVTGMDAALSVTLRMAKQAVIGGLVTDETGEPVVGATVRIQPIGQTGAWESGTTALTDDRGRYRVWTLRPGPRLVSIQPTYYSAPAGLFELNSAGDATTAATVRQNLESLNLAGADGQLPSTIDLLGNIVSASGVPASSIVGSGDRIRAFPATFHGGGKVIALEAGDGVENVDLQLVRVPAVSISGRLDGPPERVAHAFVHLIADDLPGDRPHRGTLRAASTLTTADGQFRFATVPAGRYRLNVIRPPASGSRPGPTTAVVTAVGATSVGTATTSTPPVRTMPEGDTLWASVPVVADRADISNLTVVLHRAVQMRGRIEFEGSATRPAPEQMNRISMAVWSESGDYYSVVVDASGRFQSAGLKPGQYVLRFTPTLASGTRGWYSKSIGVAGRDVTNSFIEVRETDLDAVVFTLTDRPTSLSGVVRDTGGAIAPNSTVVVFPADPAHRRAGGVSIWRVKRATVDATGRFTVDALIPGEYLAVATAADLPEDWSRLEFIKRVESSSRRVRLGEGDAANIELTLAATAPSQIDPQIQSPAEPSDAIARDDYRDADVAIRSSQVNRAAGRHASVQGVVHSDAVKRTPLGNVTVTLTPVLGGPAFRSHSDDAGRFVFEQVAPGRYRVVASKMAHLTNEHGARSPGRPGVPIEIGAGANVAVALVLPRSGVIAGRVFDDGGRPVTNAVVRALMFRGSPAGPMLMSAPGATPAEAFTDDRGEYRVWGLPPGDYLIGVTAPVSASVGRLTTEAELAWMRQSPQTRGAIPSPGPDARPGAGVLSIRQHCRRRTHDSDLDRRRTRRHRCPAHKPGGLFADWPSHRRERPRIGGRACHADARGHDCPDDSPGFVGDTRPRVQRGRACECDRESAGRLRHSLAGARDVPADRAGLETRNQRHHRIRNDSTRRGRARSRRCHRPAARNSCGRPEHRSSRRTARVSRRNTVLQPDSCRGRGGRDRGVGRARRSRGSRDVSRRGPRRILDWRSRTSGAVAAGGGEG
jgi:protocatechuate 3,4-dioxygenase beta subunit